MGQYISKYATIADYETAVASGLDTPHTALVKENMTVYFHEYVPPMPKNIITYTASAKLGETTNKWLSGLHTNAFSGKDGQLTMTSHTFDNGVGTIEFNDDVTIIGSDAFYGCGILTSITIPNGVTSIDYSAFDGCSGVTSIELPDGVTRIDYNAFSNCSSLTDITCNATTAPTIKNNTFQNVKTGGTLTVPKGSSGYDVWMGWGDYYLGKYGWTKVEQ